MEAATLEVETQPLTPECRRLPDAPADMVPVTLGDGREWPLPRPSIGFVAKVEGGRVVAQKTVEGPGDYAAPHAEATAAKDDETFVPAVFGMLLLLLRSAYRVEDDEIPRLIRWDGPGDMRFAQVCAHCIGGV